MPPPMPPSGPGPMPAAPPPTRPANPLAGLPLTDFVRDAAALVFLFSVLGTTWQLPGDDGGDQWWVVLSVLLAAASLAVPYLSRAHLIPGWTLAHYRITKVGLCLPLAVSVVGALINELVHVGDDFEGGIGVAVAFALAGLALAVQPRTADDPHHGEDPIWHQAAVIAGLGAVAVGTLQFVGFVIDNSDDVFDEPLLFVSLMLLTVGLLLAMYLWPLLDVVAHRPGAPLVWSVVGFTLLGTALLGQADDGSALFFWPPAEKWSGYLGYGGTFVLGAAIGLGAAAAVGRRTTTGGAHPYATWIRTASSALLVSAVGSVVVVVGFAFGVAVDLDDLEASQIVVVVLVVIAAVTAYLAHMLLADPQRNRLTILGLAGGTIVLGFITMGVVNGQDLGIESLVFGHGALPITGWVVASWVTLPALAVFALCAPGAVRSALGPLVTPAPQMPPQAPPATPPYPPAG